MVGVGVTSLSKLEEAVRDFHRDHEPYDDDPKRLRVVIDALELEFSSMVRRVEQRGDHLLGLRKLCNYARHIADPDGFFNEAEENHLRRRLHISLMSDGMHAIDGILDPECGAAVKAALDSLAKRRGPEDDRTRSQRMHDALAEAVHHAMDEGKLPRRNGVKPHVTVTTTLEGLKNEVGAPPADLELSLPISTRTLERIA